MAKAALWAVTDAEARKLGERTGLDTLVVLSLINLRAHETEADLVCRLLLEKKKIKYSWTASVLPKCEHTRV